jgi:calcium-dependent protein kinase
MDIDKDGKLSEEDLLYHFLTILPEEEAKDEVAKIMDEVDADLSGFIDYSEFLMAAIRKEALMDHKYI